MWFVFGDGPRMSTILSAKSWENMFFWWDQMIAGPDDMDWFMCVFVPNSDIDYQSIISLQLY